MRNAEQRGGVDRGNVPVLVPQAGSLGAVGVIRSLGQAGYPVHACAESAEALGLHSRWVRSARVHPPTTSAEFIPWVRDTVHALGIRAIVPSESFLLGLRPALDELQHLLPFFDPAQFELAFSKAELASALAGDPHLPAGRVVAGEGPALERLARLGSPLWLKADAVLARDGAPSRVLRVDGPAEAHAELVRWLPHYRRLLVQGHAPGTGVGVFFLMIGAAAAFVFLRVDAGGYAALEANAPLPAPEADPVAAAAPGPTTARPDAVAAAKEAEEKAAAEKAAADKKALEKKKAEEAAAAKKAADEKARVAREAELRRILEAEERGNALRSSDEANRWHAQIVARITRAWIRPPSAQPGITCIVLVSQVPGGEVTSVRVDSCSINDAALRESVEAAVYRASPLPPPPNPALFERNLELTFAPQ